MMLRRQTPPRPPSSSLSVPIGLTTKWLLLLLCLAFVSQTSAQVDHTISEQESKSVVLPCPVNEDKCGKLHSLNWFKGDVRIAAMLLGENNVTSVKEEFEERVTVEQNPYRLVIKDLKIGDEDIYLCDTTFFIPEETCDNFNGYRVELRVLVPPSEVVILDAKGDRIENGTTVGPMQERQPLKATCTVKNTRPQPEVGWFRGSKRLATYSPTHDLNDGLYTSTLELDWPLSREDLAQDIECRVKSAAIQDTIVSKFAVDLQVRPTSIEIKGVEHHTVQGSKVILTCDIHGARPAVNLTWYNSTSMITTEDNDLTEIRTKAFEKDDGTYHSQSELIFNATRFENDRVFRCEAENIVLQINREKPISSSLTLEVLYPPVVKVSPPNMVTNTSEIVLLNCEYVANPASLTQVVWYRNNDLLNVNDTDHYQGGNSENVALVIKSTDKEDSGNYSCQLSNTIGKGVSEQKINLDVQYVPIVEVLMIPEGPVKESDESNVTLFCNILDANPSVLTKVRWYANSTLLKELPDCEETREDLCHIDPSKLLLESIGRGFFYNYSCEGFNTAGWGPRSEDKELMVHYEPGPATLTHFPPIAVKKKSVIFSCSVEDPGYPDTNRYRWLRGGRGPLQDIVTKDWTVEPVGLDSRTNYSCYAYNEGGKGEMATVNLEVHAPPFFIKNLPPYTGILHSSPNATLTCRIECVPRCDISWLKDGVPIEKNDTRYFVKEKYVDASPATGDFESMLSVLHFNMPNWPQNKFDIEADNANYTCLSTANTVGPGIKSATYFSIEYPPDNTTVTESIVYVQEDTIPGRVICKSRANPEPSYKWIFKNETIANGNALIINTAMQRNRNGTYTCVAYNKHGTSTAETIMEVQFKPHCEIERQEIDDQDTLICTAFGNPTEADFSWSIKAENETVEFLGSGDEKSFLEKSFYVLQEDYAIARTYRCVANNTVGSGSFCEIEVAVRPKKQLAWWQRWEKTTLIILVAAILGLLLAVIIICCIIICVCRRRRRQDKYLTEVSISATQSVLSYQPVIPQAALQDTSAALLTAPHLVDPQLQSQVDPKASENNNTALSNPAPNTRFTGNAPKSPPRWPLRPGVMVHVNKDTKENLSVNRMTLKPSHSGGAGNTSQLSAQLSDILNKNQANPDSTTLTEVSGVSENELAPASTQYTAAHLNIANIQPTDGAELASLENLAAEAPTFCSPHSKVERILAFVFKRAKRTSDNGTRDSQRSQVGLLQSLWRGRAYNETTSPFGVKHRLKGIRSSGSVTYKKAPEKKKESNQVTTNTATPAEACPITDPSLVQLKASVPLGVPPLSQDTRSANTIALETKDTISPQLEERTPSIEPCLQEVISQSQCTVSPPRPPPPTESLGQIQCKDNDIPVKINAISRNCFAVPPMLQRIKEVAPQTYKNLNLHDKSSSLGDTLTEPGEYENLPFHGLQTAPSKFSTTPTNFNNNINVVRVAPRPKRLNGNISHPSESHQHHPQTLQHPHMFQDKHYCDQQVQLKHRSQFSTMHRLPTTAPHNQSLNELDMTQQVQHNLSNYFPKSTPEYYQETMRHQEIQKQLPDVAAQKFNTSSVSNVQLLHAIEHECQPTYAVVERVPPSPSIPSSSLLNTNPFKAANNFKKFDTARGELKGSACRRTMNSSLDMEKKFNSLKFPCGNKFKKQAYSGNSSMASTTSPNFAMDISALSKCKRHHSFAGNSHTDIDSGSPPIHLYDPPAYRNIVEQGDDCNSNLNSNQNLSTVQLHSYPGGEGSAVVQQKKRHHHRQHQQNSECRAGTGAEFQLFEPERFSIYRSDSGISNSSHESQLPLALSQQRSGKSDKKDIVISSSCPIGRKPVYINKEGQRNGLVHADSATHVNSSYESASSNSHSAGCGASNDPTSLSLSSSASIHSGGTAGPKAFPHFPNQHQQQTQSVRNDITTPEDFEQYQLGHQPTNSNSAPTVVHSLNAASKSKCRRMDSAECSIIYKPYEKINMLATNPFLANKGNNSSCIGINHKKKLRRQTISDPYAHINRQLCARKVDIGNANANRSESFQTHINSLELTKLHPESAASEQWRITDNPANIISSKIETSAFGERREQMLIPKELMLQASLLGSTPAMENLRYVPTVTPPTAMMGPMADGAYDCLVVRRPICLPLRKHHTFHFQNTQTANGKLQQLRQKLQHQQWEKQKIEQEEGPLVFRPLALNEQHAFKPISPTPIQTTKAIPKANMLNSSSVPQTQHKTQSHIFSARSGCQQQQQHEPAMKGIDSSSNFAAEGSEGDEDLGYSFCEEDNESEPTLAIQPRSASP